jgi:2-succinyl-6-hydroxy-2,4-cyclohexadiene-1-carboxylate synthase
MPFFERAGERMWYETYGDPTALPVYAIHGFTGNHAAWEALAASKVGGGCYVVAPDVYGHGWSSTPEDLARYRLPALARDLWALWDHLGAGRPVLLGYSMGGRIALEMAVSHPGRVRGLILESASPGIEDDAERTARAEADLALARRIESEGIEAFVDYWEDLPLFQSQHRLDPARREQVRRDRLSQSAHGLAQSLRGTGTGFQESRWGALPSLNVPTLLIVGTLDKKYCAMGQRMAARLPRAALVEIADAGHTPHLEQPDTFIAVVDRFLKELSGPTG